MGILSKLFQKIFLNDLDRYSQSLGFSTWKELRDHSFHIFTIPPDAEWFITELPNKKWAAWNDEGQPPFEYVEFATWEEAIKYVREVFEESGITEENWEPEVFELNDDLFLLLPDKNKRPLD
ncbi:hypothetical protein M4D55_25315 [Metabacillus idriensis]|uniref:hypothetical protein n=1 Tax=Metabacillus idriensis TaxID=324768 RepID=UPI00203E3D00|nr:hypothetical protein [Metabacillus idriensis]MCM3599059.1 hypothetical protein [Metabacillus idriensis]